MSLTAQNLGDMQDLKKKKKNLLKLRDAQHNERILGSTGHHVTFFYCLYKEFFVTDIRCFSKRNSLNI